MLDIVDILKYCHYPKGGKLYSPICGECELKDILYEDEVIVVSYRKETVSKFYELRHNNVLYFDKYGRYEHSGDVVLFPSKDDMDWENFRRNCLIQSEKDVVVDFDEGTGPYKRGDFVVSTINTIAIYKSPGRNGTASIYCALQNVNGTFFDVIRDQVLCENFMTVTRLANENEKQRLINAIENHGFRWVPETNTLIQKW